ncbi:MAG: helix-hairpin-helix domain-containing protein [Betaproteobacteria bacterium]
MKRLLALFCALLLAFALPALAADKDAKAPAKAVAAQAKADDKIDINRAKADELMKLDGIGEARAKAIIKGRPYKGKDDLVAKNIVPQAVYDKIADQIIAKQK